MSAKPNTCLRVFPITLLILAFSSCAGMNTPPPQTHYYTLAYDPPVAAFKAPGPAILQINRLQASPPFDSNRIIYAENAFKRSAYVYQQWLTPPVDMVTDLLVRDLRAANVAQAITLSYANPLPATHILKATIDAFYEDDVGKTWQAVLAISMTLETPADSDTARQILLQKTYQEKTALDQNNPLGLAQAMSRALSQVSLRLINDIHPILLKAP